MDLATIGGGIAAVGLMGLLFKDAFKNDDTVHEPEHGNVHGGAAVAATMDEVEAAGLTWQRAGGFFVTAVRLVKEKTVRWLRFQHETGLLLFGAPGTGKGAGMVIPTLLDRDKNTRESLLVFDTAAQNIFVTGSYLRSIGARVVYSNLDGKHTAGLRDTFGAPLRMNPLGIVPIDDPLAELTITETAGALVPVQGGKNSYFSGAAQNLTASTGIWLRETEGMKATWPKVAELLHGSAWDMNQMFAAMKQSRFASVRATANQWYREVDPETGKLQGTPTEGMRDVLSTARRELAFLLNNAISAMFGGDFDFASMKQERTVYFLVLPDSESDAIKKCGYLVLRTAKQALMVPGGMPVLWILDEMAAALPAGAGADLIKDVAALVRKYRIRIAGICQSWAQFQDWCGDAVKADALRGMFGAAIYYGANDNTSIQHIMQEVGKATIWTPASNPLQAAGLEGNSAPMGVPLFQPEDIRAMIAENKMIVSLIGARKVCALPRSSYRDVPELRARAAEDIYHKDK